MEKGDRGGQQRHIILTPEQHKLFQYKIKYGFAFHILTLINRGSMHFIVLNKNVRKIFVYLTMASAVIAGYYV